MASIHNVADARNNGPQAGHADRCLAEQPKFLISSRLFPPVLFSFRPRLGPGSTSRRLRPLPVPRRPRDRRSSRGPDCTRWQGRGPCRPPSPLVVKKGSNTWLRSPGGIPGPSSSHRDPHDNRRQPGRAPRHPACTDRRALEGHLYPPARAHRLGRVGDDLRCDFVKLPGVDVNSGDFVVHAVRDLRGGNRAHRTASEMLSIIRVGSDDALRSRACRRRRTRAFERRSQDALPALPPRSAPVELLSSEARVA